MSAQDIQARHDYFVVNAPAEIPDWFEFEFAEPYPKFPDPEKLLSKEHQEQRLLRVSKWLVFRRDDERYEAWEAAMKNPAPEVLAYESLLKEFERRQYMYVRRAHRARWLAWRQWFADEMVRGGAK